MKTNLLAMSDDIAEIKAAMLQSKIIFSAKEAADYMSIALSTLYKLTSAGILPFSKPNGKLIYFSKAGLDEWLLSNTSKSGVQKDLDAATYLSIKH